MAGRGKPSGTRPTLWRGWVLVGSLGLLPACGECDSISLVGESNKPVQQPSACVVEQHRCGDGESFRDGRCRQLDCQTDGDCCPGTRCDPSLNVCRSRLMDQACFVDADCPIKGQHCEQLEDGWKTCRFHPCRNQGDCTVQEEYTHCFNGQCVGESPCPRGCGIGEVCDVATASCHPAAGREGCDTPCEEGTVRVVTHPDEMSGLTCCPWTCRCVSLPPLQPGVHGSHASVVVGRTEVAVASYDLTYGDLVLTRFAPDGARLSLEYVDGFPARGTVVGALDGPRGGVREPGEDVGRHASAAVDAHGRIHVAYHDATHGALKHAVNMVGHEWSLHTVDDQGVAGQYASLAISSVDGFARIAYLTWGVTDGAGVPVTMVKLATARSALPQGPEDWDVVVVDSDAVPDPCNHQCGDGSACVEAPAGDGGSTVPTCVAQAELCSPSCASGQACVQWTEGATCMPLGQAPVAGLPTVLGLFTSLTLRGEEAVVAYQDNIRGWLKAAVVSNASQTITPVVVDGDGQGEHVLGHVGAFVSAATDGLGKLAMAYADVTHNQLRFFHGSSLSSGTYRVVDSGQPHGTGMQLLGASASLAFAPDGTAYVAYQDQTTLDLKVAQREADGSWSVQTPLSQGPYGFYADLGMSSGVAYVASVRPALDDRRRVANQLGLLVLPIPFP